MGGSVIKIKDKKIKRLVKQEFDLLPDDAKVIFTDGRAFKKGELPTDWIDKIYQADYLLPIGLLS